MSGSLRKWRLELVESCPDLLYLGGDPPSAKGFPGARDGWGDLAERPCAHIWAADNETFHATQIKEKYGTLRNAVSMKVITIMQDGELATRFVYVRTDGDVTVFDRNLKFRFRTDISGTETTWQILRQVVPAIVRAEIARLKIEALSARCRTGRRPGYPNEIDPDIPQRTLRRAVRHRPDLLSGRRRVLQPGHHFDGSRLERPGPGDRRDLLDRYRPRVGGL
ncbi:hypothetical protein SAMN05216338_105726 [Bradyrhizobium sp. Rc2d]|uniref:hypothetical protein n=1 Tax=Bradyrhizobium sp. Rc2d TaxID=1855321 RepID=UPI000889981F|nr:hypothetical protein [Bradyrhizobium sp. Rc2d]SDJ63147.1 hypothetical protein SAMN05216338_105726 [Bradyrhizobium sp. Rc2d]